jgi:hypothetical protein
MISAIRQRIEGARINVYALRERFRLLNASDLLVSRQLQATMRAPLCQSRTP